jgi:transposase-like protein
VLLSQGKTVAQASKALEISQQTYYRWRREYGGMDKTQAKKLKELEKENTRLKKLVADLSLVNVILKLNVRSQYERTFRDIVNLTSAEPPRGARPRL